MDKNQFPFLALPNDLKTKNTMDDDYRFFFTEVNINEGNSNGGKVEIEVVKELPPFMRGLNVDQIKDAVIDPLHKFKNDFIDGILNNQVLIVFGEMEFDKATQLPQYLIEAKFFTDGKKIGCTHPRRKAAIAAAKKLAEEMDCSLGQKVGFKIRFEDCTSSETIIKFMTDGALLLEFSTDPDFNSYSVIIVDNAHERSIHTDVILALLKNALKRRSDLKLIVTSENFEGCKFSSYFDGAPILNIPNRSSPTPEIQRSDLATFILQLKAMGINDFMSFEFLDRPPVYKLIAGFQELHSLSAINDEGYLTKLGRLMAEFPLEPMLSKMLVMSVQLKCSEEILTIVSMLSVQNLLTGDEKVEDEFLHPGGDLLTLLASFESWKKNKSSQDFIKQESFVQVQQIREQLLVIMNRMKLDVVTCGEDFEKIQKAICCGFFRNACKRNESGEYRTLLTDNVVFVHPSSSLFDKNPEFLVYHDDMAEGEKCMRNVTVIDPKWLIGFAPSIFKISDMKCN